MSLNKQVHYQRQAIKIIFYDTNYIDPLLPNIQIIQLMALYKQVMLRGHLDFRTSVMVLFEQTNTEII